MAEPSLDSIAGSFAALEATFQPEKAGGVIRTFQFEFTGREPGIWTLAVNNGHLETHEGPTDTPNAIISIASDDWLKLLRGELNGVSAFMSGKLKVNPSSSAMDLMQFQTWFARPA